jgi:RNA polymerase sigma factor for flagellar operon FliA
LAAGYLGLVEAAEKFDTKRGNEFSSYAFLRIRGSIVDAIRKNSEITGRAYKTAKALMAAYSMRSSSEEDPAVNRLTTKKGLSQVLDFAAKSSLIFRLSLGEAQDETGEITSPAPNPEEKLLTEQNQKLLRSIIASLPEKERFIIEQYYFKDLTFEEIGRLSGSYGKSWTSRIHARAINMIRDRYYEAINQES